MVTTAVQNAVPRELLGTATASGVMFRQIGGSLAVAVFGAITDGADGGAIGWHVVLDRDGADGAGASRPDDPDDDRHHIVDAIAPIYWLVSVVAVLGVTAAWPMREIPLRQPPYPAAG